ncbi:hypothetical protein [Listeria fleischmannii]|nr:hypothetical protein [Listeria fleischmannii]
MHMRFNISGLVVEVQILKVTKENARVARRVFSAIYDALSHLQ